MSDSFTSTPTVSITPWTATAATLGALNEVRIAPAAPLGTYSLTPSGPSQALTLTLSNADAAQVAGLNFTVGGVRPTVDLTGVQTVSALQAALNASDAIVATLDVGGNIVVTAATPSQEIVVPNGATAALLGGATVAVEPIVLSASVVLPVGKSFALAPTVSLVNGAVKVGNGAGASAVATLNADKSQLTITVSLPTGHNYKAGDTLDLTLDSVITAASAATAVLNTAESAWTYNLSAAQRSALAAKVGTLGVVDIAAAGSGYTDGLVSLTVAAPSAEAPRPRRRPPSLVAW
jgi:hypothetical protein